MGYKLKRILIYPDGVTEKQVYPAVKTFTISRTEQSNMSSGWTYSDDAAGLTAGSTAFDDFFGYSAVLLDTSGNETSEMTQSGGVFSGAMSTLGNITSGDNVMIKFPVRGIKMTKSGSVVTLSITKELNKDGYQYYAFQTGTLSNPGTPKDAFYLGAYEGYSSSNVLKSWSGRNATNNKFQSVFCTYAKANGDGYNIEGFYQRQYVNALYLMKYGNPNCQSVVGKGVTYSSYYSATGGTNSQTSATYGTSASNAQIKLFGLEDRWGNHYEFIGGVCTNGSNVIYTTLSGWSGAVTTSSPYESTSAAVVTNPVRCISGVSGTNSGLFVPTSGVSNTSFNTYYCDGVGGYGGCIFKGGGYRQTNSRGGAFEFIGLSTDDQSEEQSARLMFL